MTNGWSLQKEGFDVRACFKFFYFLIPISNVSLHTSYLNILVVDLFHFI